jgi:hypothetical protein
MVSYSRNTLCTPPHRPPLNTHAHTAKRHDIDTSPILSSPRGGQNSYLAIDGAEPTCRVPCNSSSNCEMLYLAARPFPTCEQILVNFVSGAPPVKTTASSPVHTKRMQLHICSAFKHNVQYMHRHTCVYAVVGFRLATRRWAAMRIPSVLRCSSIASSFHVASVSGMPNNASSFTK